MGRLSEVIQDRQRRRAVVDDAVQTIEEEVKSKRGFTGVAVKAAFKVVKGVKPGFIGQAMDHLLDDFSAQIDPYYDRWKASGSGDLPSYFTKNSQEIGNSLLSITDGRAQGAKNKAIKKAYTKLRPQALDHVTQAMPRVGKLVAKHVGA